MEALKPQQRYMLMWDKILTADIMRESDLREIKEQNLRHPPVYCIFAYTPFEQSICSLWLTNLHAYIVSNVLTKEYQHISDIIVKVQKLLKESDSNSIEKIKTLFIKFLNELIIYEIIDIKADNSVDNTVADRN